MRSVTKRRLELVVQALAAVNACWCFPPRGSTVGCIFALRPRIACDTTRCGVPEMYQGFCGGGLWSVSGCGFVTTAVRPFGATALRHAPIARLLSGIEGETLAVVGWGVTLQSCQRSARRSPDFPVWPASMTWTWGGRLAQMVRRTSYGMSGARPLRCRRNLDGFRSPISSCECFLMRCSWGGQPAHQLCFKPVIGFVLRWCDVLYFGRVLLELRHHVVEFRSLARDDW